MWLSSKHVQLCRVQLCHQHIDSSSRDGNNRTQSCQLQTLNIDSETYTACHHVKSVISINEMNGDLGHDSALQRYTGPGTTWANEINFMDHAPGAESIARPVGQ